MKFFRESPSTVWVYMEETRTLLRDLRACRRCAFLYTAFLKDLRRQTLECTREDFQRERDECLDQLWRYKVEVFEDVLQSKNSPY